MTHRTNLPGRFNPYKATAQETETARRAKAWYAQFCESVKDTSPKLYQDYQKQKATEKERQALYDALLDDPEMIAIMDEVTRNLEEKQAKSFSAEYALLGIEPGATKREIKNAYRRMARKLHPDKGGDPEAFKAMHAAYRRLLAATSE